MGFQIHGAFKKLALSWIPFQIFAVQKAYLPTNKNCDENVFKRIQKLAPNLHIFGKNIFKSCSAKI